MYTELNMPLHTIPFDTVYVSSKIGSRYRGMSCCDNIISLDIETTSYFINAACEPVLYDYNNPHMDNPDGSPMIRQGLMYHWQIDIDGNKFVGRSWEDMELFFTDLHQLCKSRKFIFIHNASFEFSWLINIITFSGEDDTVLARDPHRVMSAYCKRFNMELRCTYFLTQLSLSKWAENIGLEKSKDLDYNVLRTPWTILSHDEMNYCLTDVDIMYHGLLRYKEKYKHMYNIPLTQTGEVRRELRKVYKHEHDFYDKCAKLQPQSLKKLQWLLKAFYGGCVLCNPAYKDVVIKVPLIFKDISSSYPWALISERYPLTPFRVVFNKQKQAEHMQDPDKTYIIEFTAENVKSKIPCLFLSASKLEDKINVKTMNGRVATADSFRCILCKPDFELFQKCYKADITIHKLKISDLQYLPDGFRRFVIEMYQNKTKLKKSDPELYQKSKQIINALFGINCQKLITDLVKFDIHEDGDGWIIEELSEENFPKLLHDVLYNPDGSRKKLYTATQIGIYCTAYARKNLFTGVLGEDEEGNFLNVDDVIYTDTDSIKQFDNEYADDIYNKYNAAVLAKHKEIAAQLGLDPADLSPELDGKAYPIGIFAEDGKCTEFKTMGSKKYCYRDADTGKLKLTVAGVPKSGVECLDDDINNFCDGMIFKASEMDDRDLKLKMASVYCTDQQPCTFPDGYVARDKYGICMMPVDYTLTASYDMYSDPDEFYRILWAASRQSKLLT